MCENIRYVGISYEERRNILQKEKKKKKKERERERGGGGVIASKTERFRGEPRSELKDLLVSCQQNSKMFWKLLAELRDLLETERRGGGEREERERDRERERERERQTDRQTDRQTEKETETETDRNTETEREPDR